jgi:hypothetical protein
MQSFSMRRPTTAVKVLIAGAVLAAGTAGFALPHASAASPTTWSAFTNAKADFQCASGNCMAGGIGGVANGAWVGPDTEAKPIGAWARTVFIHCKSTTRDVIGTPVKAVQVEVQDTNWAGLWLVNRNQLSQVIDDTTIPDCAATH